MLRHRNIKILFSLGISLSIAIGLWFWSDINSKPVRDLNKNIDLELNLEIINRLWTNPDVKKYKNDPNFQCPSIQVGLWKSLPKRYFQCNVDFLSCAIRHEFQERLDYGGYQMKPVLPVQIKSSDTIERVLRLEHVKNRKKYNVHLVDNCHEVEIPKGRYKSGEIKSTGILFDVDQKVYIDRQLMNYGKLRNLKKAFPKKLVQLNSNFARRWYDPVVHLSKDMMKQLCHLSGKEVLTSEFFDAATFLPKQLDGHHQNEFKAPYLYSHSKIIENALGKKPCNRLVSKECVEEDFVFIEQFSWTGIGQVHGGIMEYLEPVFSHDRHKNNIWASSRYFKRESLYHYLGNRLSWTTDTLLKKSFRDEKPDRASEEFDQLPEKLEVGFRCYRKSY